MSTRAFDAFTRGAADAASRRNALLALGGAVLAASLVAPEAGVAKKKKGKDCKKKEKQRCSNDAAACKPTLLSICMLTPQECALAAACCDECSANGFLTCLLAVTASGTAALN